MGGLCVICTQMEEVCSLLLCICTSSVGCTIPAMRNLANLYGWLESLFCWSWLLQRSLGTCCPGVKCPYGEEQSLPAREVLCQSLVPQLLAGCGVASVLITLHWIAFLVCTTCFPFFWLLWVWCTLLLCTNTGLQTLWVFLHRPIWFISTPTTILKTRELLWGRAFRQLIWWLLILSFWGTLTTISQQTLILLQHTLCPSGIS